MPRTINRVELLGRVGAEPEMRYTQGDTAVTQLRLATDRRRQDGETTADWHVIVCWGKLAEAVHEYVARETVSTSLEGSYRAATRRRTGSAGTRRRFTHRRWCSWTPATGAGRGMPAAMPRRRRPPPPSRPQA